eukprot:TRINITY_DN2399_c0_g1_i3.p1 TRINITY_DN2399_c0_g1~~TRINITY_DN2399_c0_g1_i3.p1  ORF type:complete len:253 (-),score=18.55 TRINITY_DN2399_c0_g1_i3:10-768(-)
MQSDVESSIERSRAAQQGGKASKVLGQDSLSSEKISSKLGIEAEEIQQAAVERAEREEEKLRRTRDVECVRDRKNAQKALDVLGLDASIEKLKNRLGVDEEVIVEAQREEFERQEESIRKQRRNSCQMDRRHVGKALDVLGHNPSEEKVISLLGMDEEDLKLLREENGHRYERSLKRRRSVSTLNRRTTGKAQRVLGLYPSRDKIIDRLGIDSSVVDNTRVLLLPRGGKKRLATESGRTEQSRNSTRRSRHS